MRLRCALLFCSFVAAGCSSSAEKCDYGSPGEILASELLGRPTATSVTVSVVPQVDLELYLEYGTTSGVYPERTAAAAHPGVVPVVTTLEGLAPAERYFYRLRWRVPGAPDFATGAERTFHTARAPGQAFVVAVQADPHLDDKSSPELYQRTLANEAADAPDFMIDLGDTFMCDKHTVPLSAEVQSAPDYDTVAARYLCERSNFGMVAHSAPLFLVNGNHEGESGWLLDGTGDNLAVWATQARKTFFPVPAPDGFYSGSSTEEPLVGQRGSFYAWQWGDALFVVLDPYWYTTRKPKDDAWAWTLGREQYQWLVDTLAQSSAAFRFVFIHNLVGGADAQARGGIEAAPFYEWGGQNADGTPGFDAARPGWGKPIHRLFVDNHVTAVFHGHDHVFVQQQLDGIVYQETPQPSATNFDNGPVLAAQGHYATGVVASSAGHLRLTVGPTETKVDYVRAYRPEDERADRHNGDVSVSYTMVPR